MQVHYDIDKLPLFTNSVITIGTFDGIHSGHHAILDQLIQEGSKHEGVSIVITFHPHPRKIIRAGEAPSLLTSIDERIALFQKKAIGQKDRSPDDHRARAHQEIRRLRCRRRHRL